MSIRELTLDEERRLLSAEEVRALPTGTRVYIKWSGGNGPHLYTITQRDGCKAWANECRATIDFVGKERFHTRVFLPDEAGRKGLQS